MGETKLSAPWFEFVQKLRAMFGDDPDIRIRYNDEESEVTLFVSNTAKAEALTKLLPCEKEFGNVKLKITVKPANDENPIRSLLLTAFAGNPVLKEVNEIADGAFAAMYVIFKKEVVQYYNDNMGDPDGMTHTLYQTIAEDLFEDMPGVFFTTETKFEENIFD